MKHKRILSAFLGILMLLLQIIVLPLTPVEAVTFGSNDSGEVYVHTPLGNLGRHSYTSAVPWGITNIELRRYPGPVPGSIATVDSTGTFLTKAFCLEPNVQVNFPFIEKFAPHAYTWNSYWGTADQRNMLGRIAWYGWETSGRSQTDQAITQAAVWQYLNPGLAGGFTDRWGNSLTTQISNVLHKAKIHKESPRFRGPGWDETTRTLTMKPGDSVTLTPTSDSPDISASEVQSGSVSGLSISPQGNSLVVTSTTDIDPSNNPFKIKMSRLKLNEADLSTHFLVHRNSQDILSTAGIDPADYEFIVEFEASAELEIIKTDEATGRPLDGAEFRIADEEGVAVKVKEIAPGQYTARDGDTFNIKTLDGTAKVTDLPAGSYRVVEVVVPANYAEPANAMHPVLLEDNALSRISITNTELPADLMILKVDAATGERIPLSGVEFSLYSTQSGGDPINIQGNTVFQTDADGSVKLSDFKAGIYYIEELNPPAGYILPRTRTKVELKPGSSIELKINNINQVGKIQIEKIGPALTSYNFEEITIDRPEQDEFYEVSVEVPETFVEEPEITHELTSNPVHEETEIIATEVLTENTPPTVLDTTTVVTEPLAEPSQGSTRESTEETAIEGETLDTGEASSEVETSNLGGITDTENSIENETASVLSDDDETILPTEATSATEGVLTVEPILLNPALYRRYFGYMVSLSAVPTPGSVEDIETSTAHPEPNEIGLTYQIIDLDTNAIVSKDLKPVDGMLQVNLKNGHYVAESTNKPGDAVRVEFEVSEAMETQQQKLQKLIPVFTENQKLENATFEIIAGEDIYSQSAKLVGGKWERVLLYKKGDLVDTVTTGSDGTGISHELPLGLYQVKETKAPEGYSLDPTISTIRIKQVGQVSRLVQVSRTFTNTRQKLSVSFEKTFEESKWFNYHKEAPTKTLFGLYTVDEYTENGVTIPANSLIETSGLELNESGQWMAAFEPLFAGTYKLVELHTGESYDLLDPVEFCLDYTSNAETVSKVLDEIHNEIVKSDIKVIKVDSTDERPIANVVFELLRLGNDGTEEVIGTYETDETGKISVQDLEFGEYIFQEVSIPEGYTTPKNDRHNVTVDASGSLIEVRVENEPTQVRFTKKRLVDEEELPGAKLSLRDSNGDLIEEWISSEEPHEIKRLKVNETYTLTEDYAPLGYTTAQSISFTILDTGEIQTVTMFNDFTWIDILKVDSITGDAIAGAELELVSTDGEVISTWTSSPDPHTIRGLAIGESYLIRETKAPIGYAMAREEVSFIVEDSHEIQAITFENSKASIEFSKIDFTNGKELPGAMLSLRDDAGRLIDEWISSNEPHTIMHLEVGKTYTLTEDLAPLGYATAQSITFEIEDNGEVQRVVMVDDVTKVSLSKVDLTTGEELPGARLSLYDSSGNLIEEWTSSDEPHLIEKLLVGETYILTEDLAPIGYTKVQSIEFTIEDTDEVQKIVMKDDITHISLTKTDLISEEPVPGAKIIIRNTEGEVVYEEITDENGVISIDKIPTGSYTFQEEIHPEGYILNAETFAFAIHEDGGVTGDTEFTNEPTALRIFKRDTDGRPLSGAEFNLRKRDSDEIIRAKIEDGIYIANASGPEDRLISNEQGDIEVRYLPQGEYDLVEVKAPQGYELDGRVHKLSVHETSGTTSPAEVIITNRPITPDIPKVPDAGDDLGKYALIIGLTVIGLISLLFGVIGKRRQRRL